MTTIFSTANFFQNSSFEANTLTKTNIIVPKAVASAVPIDTNGSRLCFLYAVSCDISCKLSFYSDALMAQKIAEFDVVGGAPAVEAINLLLETNSQTQQIFVASDYSGAQPSITISSLKLITLSDIGRQKEKLRTTIKDFEVGEIYELALIDEEDSILIDLNCRIVQIPSQIISPTASFSLYINSESEANKLAGPVSINTSEVTSIKFQRTLSKNDTIFVKFNSSHNNNINSNTSCIINLCFLRRA